MTERMFNRARIREIREGLGLTTAEFAARIGTTGQAVVYWESGERVPTVPTLLKIVNVTGAKLESFFIPAKKVS